MTLTEYEIQLGNELALINYGSVFKRLKQKQKLKVVDEFVKVRSLGDVNKIEQYLLRKRGIR